jgi:hypothetical protein
VTRRETVSFGGSDVGLVRCTLGEEPYVVALFEEKGELTTQLQEKVRKACYAGIPAFLPTEKLEALWKLRDGDRAGMETGGLVETYEKGGELRIIRL